MDTKVSMATARYFNIPWILLYISPDFYDIRFLIAVPDKKRLNCSVDLPGMFEVLSNSLLACKTIVGYYESTY
jgi:hypothetical protein